MRCFVLIIALASSVFGADVPLTPQMQSLVNRISPASLRGHLSFISSDSLEGRLTPSRGLDIAAEYIAAQFRRAGLEPIGDDGYFQTATLAVREPNYTGFEMTITSGGKAVKIEKEDVYILTARPLAIDNLPIIHWTGGTPSPEQINGKVVYISDFRLIRSMRGYQPALLFLSSAPPTGHQGLIDNEAPRASRRPSANVLLRPDVGDLLKDPHARVTIHMQPFVERTVKGRNVAAVLRGSDPALRDTYVMLTAHYDHIGTTAYGEDRIYNGANDDGSGTVSVIEIASAMASMRPHPKRSILFMTFFGEEAGGVGSRYYVRHPLVPIDKTVADLNLEQIGRTDAANGKQVSNASVTGFDFSDLPAVLREEGQRVGIKVYKDEQSSDEFFSRSDNQPLADAGIPAHTLCVAFEFPDYHQVGDHWQKIDYDNMAKVDRAVALGLLRLASDAPPPKWNESNPAAKKYVDAAKKLK
ncbi:MAG TPA: M28 family peptidase [Bryobacteraceae bacterium]|jgi:hypothetical protein|nr:M28 family peptidase [Bryobacteraceae bacterium]